MSVHTPTPVDSRPSRAIVLGGARSGKSTFAESQLAQCEVVTYVATSARNPDDPEWTERIRLHQQRRPESWRTAETLDVFAVLLDDDARNLFALSGVLELHGFQVLHADNGRKGIEMLLAHLKRILKLDRLRLRGPNGARDEFHLAAAAQNLRKLAKLLPNGPQFRPA